MESSGIFQTVFEAGFAPANEFPFSGGWLINQHTMLEKLPMEKVKAATINKVSDNELQKQQWISKYAAQIESMEGAALHYVCLQEKIPFLQIRSVSNWVGERDRTKWKMKEALENLGAELIKTIQFIRSSNS
jgi:futalosine hydrolase